VGLRVFMVGLGGTTCFYGGTRWDYVGLRVFMVGIGGTTCI
jgi:hypothetical protein